MKMKSSFTLTKIDNINLKKYKIVLKEYKKAIDDLLKKILTCEELKKSKIFSPLISKIRFDISLCNDETIRKINKEYRNKNSSTDVITFSLFYDDNNSTIHRKTADLGQIIVSVETADKQKGENNLKTEILTLICHGILHLIGFDHLTKKDYDFVVGVQKKVLKEL